MSNQQKSVHWSFWIIAVAAFIWNDLGATNFIMQLDPEVVASMPETHRAIIDTRPAWATAGFAIGVFGGVLGSLLLLFRKRLAIIVYVASLIGVLVTMIHTLGLKIAFSPIEMVMMVVMPIVVAVALIWYAKSAQGKGWLG